LKELHASRFVVHGRVQGVGYRYFVMAAAQELGLNGYARNLDDGTVEVVAVGPKSLVEDLLGSLQQGPMLAEVRHIEREPAPIENFGPFHIR
jgi:acylphosphatase